MTELTETEITEPRKTENNRSNRSFTWPSPVAHQATNYPTVPVAHQLPITKPTNPPFQSPLSSPLPAVRPQPYPRLPADPQAAAASRHRPPRPRGGRRQRGSATAPAPRPPPGRSPPGASRRSPFPLGRPPAPARQQAVCTSPGRSSDAEHRLLHSSPPATGAAPPCNPRRILCILVRSVRSDRRPNRSTRRPKCSVFIS